MSGHALNQARALLQSRRADLVALAAASAADSAPVELDQQKLGRLSRMDALQNQAMAQETARRRDVELQRIDAALARVDKGVYGMCVRCDEPIEPGRLKADPATPICVDCAQG